MISAEVVSPFSHSEELQYSTLNYVFQLFISADFFIKK